MTVFVGEVRIRGKNGEPDRVRVTDKIGDMAYEVSEEEYHQRAFRPPLEDLPWWGKPDA